jgi:hypothetical protein
MAIKPSSLLDKKIPADEEIIPIRGSELNEWETILSRIRKVDMIVPAIIGALIGTGLTIVYFVSYNIRITHKIDIINSNKDYIIMSLMNSSSYNTSVHHLTGIQNGMTITEEVPLVTTQPQMFVVILGILFATTIIAYAVLYGIYREQEFGLIGHVLSQINLAKKKHLQKKK